MNPQDQSRLDEDISDLELQEEAKRLDNIAYKLVLRALETLDIIDLNNIKLVNQIVTSQEVYQRLNNNIYQVYRGKTYIAKDYDYEGQISIIGPRAKVAIY